MPAPCRVRNARHETGARNQLRLTELPSAATPRANTDQAVLPVANAAVGASLRSADLARIGTSVNFAGTSGLGKFTFSGPFADAGGVDGTQH